MNAHKIPSGSYFLFRQKNKNHTPFMASILFFLILFFTASQANASLDLSMTAGPDPVQPNETIHYTIVVKNTGPDSLNNVKLRNTVPSFSRIWNATTEPAAACISGGNSSVCGAGGILSWSLGTLLSGESRIFQIPVQLLSPATGTIITNQADVTYDGASSPTGIAREVVAEEHTPLRLELEADADPVAPGALLTYKLTVGNTGDDIFNAMLKAKLPEGVSFVSASDGGACGNCSLRNPPSANEIAWTPFNLPSGANSYRTLTVRVDDNLADGEVVTLDSWCEHDIGPMGGVRNEVRVETETALSISMTAGADPVLAGGTLHYTVVVKNTGVVSLNNVKLRNIVPSSSRIWNATTEPTGTCLYEGNSSVCGAGGILGWSLGTLLSGESRIIQIPAQLLSPPGGALINNRLEATYDEADIPVAAEHVVPVEAVPPVMLKLEADADPVAPGALLTYKLSYGNSGEDIFNAMLKAQLPEGVSFVSASGGGVLSGNEIEWTPFNLSTGANAYQTLTLLVDEDLYDGEVLTLDSWFEHDIGPAGGVRNEVRVQAETALSISMTAGPDPVLPGETLHYTVVVKNTGLSSLNNVKLRNIVPSFSRIWNATTEPAGSCLYGGNSSVCGAGGLLGWSLGSMLSGESRVIQIPVQLLSPSGGTLISHRLEATYDEADMPVAAERVAAVETTSPVMLKIETDADPVAPGALLTYKLVYGNTGEDVFNAMLAAPLPQGVSYVSASHGGGLYGDVIRWAPFTLSSDSNGALSFTVRVNEDLLDGEVLSLHSWFEHNIGPSGGVNTDVRIETDTPLQVSLQSDSDFVQGTNAHFTVIITNTGPGILTHVNVRNIVPSFSRIWVATTEPAGSCLYGGNSSVCGAGGLLGWSLGTMLSGETRIIQIPVQLLTSSLGTLIHNRLEVVYQSAGMPVEAAHTVIIDTDPVSPASVPSPTSAFIARLYNTILGRYIDIGGLEYWLSIIQTQSAALVTQGFFNSAEFENMGLGDAAYIDILYQTIFNRAADDEGRAYWLALLQGGTLRDMVLYGFLLSQEFSDLADRFSVTAFSDSDNALYQIKLFVIRFYQLVLNRPAELDGYYYWSEQLSRGAQSATDIAMGFFFSQEFINKNYDDVTFIEIAYKTLLNRIADQGGKDYWSSQLSSGLTRIELINGFLNSQEFQALADSYGIRVRGNGR